MEYWIWLSIIEKKNYTITRRLLDIYKTPEEISKLSKKELEQLEVEEQMIQEMTNPNYRRIVKAYMLYMKEKNIQILTIKDEDYPYLLKQIYDPPSVIYIMGNKKILSQNGIAIVGSRNCSLYGQKIAKHLSYQLAKKGIHIISGLARGIDTFSHIGTLQAKGKTIAVLGSGLDVIYPPENAKLAEKIVESGGCLVSEYIVGTKPLGEHFPARNRIISGLASGVVVVEASEKSGSLITVDFALEQGKNVYAVPGNINSPNSLGTNSLIKQGAKIVTSIEDILEDL